MTELSRPLPLDRIGPAGLEQEVEATPAECQALALRLRIPAVIALRCRFRLTRLPGNAVAAEGELASQVVQTCVVTLEEFEQQVAERFAVQFVPGGTEAGDDEDPEAPDQIPFEGRVIDLGEAAAEQLALALDPYPRKPGAKLGAAPDPASHPFAALDALRRRH